MMISTNLSAAAVLCCLVFIALIHPSTQEVEPCVRVTDCSCKFKSGKTIDYSTKAPADGGVWKTDLNNGFDYDWNPCTALKKARFSNTALSQADKGGNEVTIGFLGVPPPEFELTPDKQHIQLRYGGMQARISLIKLICDPNIGEEGTYKFINEDPQLTYNLEFTSSLNCDENEMAGSSSGWTPGGVILLILGVAIIVYLMGGVLVNKVVFKKEGIKEILPNPGFWSAFPGLTKEGGKFLVSKVRGRSSGYSEM